jgi:methylated-DNA-protein-cysteine methyltransferase related protein
MLKHSTDLRGKMKEDLGKWKILMDEKPEEAHTDAGMTDFTEKVIAVITSIPYGRVATYGNIAAAAGNPRGARQVARILHSCSSSYQLPWHRVVSSNGQISLPEGAGREEQASMLSGEGVEIPRSLRIDLGKYRWNFQLPD